MGSLGEQRGSAVFYESFYVSTKDLDDKTFREAWTALLEYAFYGNDPEDISPISSMFFNMAKPLIDKAAQAKEWGKAGGRPKKKGGFENKKGGFESKKAPIYDVDEDVDVDVDKDVDVDVDVDMPVPGGRTTTHTDTSSETDTTGRPSNLDVLGELVSKGYQLTPASIKAFMDYNDERGWKMDWRLALKRWADREVQHPPDQPVNKAGKFANFEQRNDPKHKAMVAQLIEMQTAGGD